jgi:4-amino-4-deoxy-L-arabinose transferase-like glycosyltransferase
MGIVSKKAVIATFALLLIFASRIPTLRAPILNIDEADFAVQSAVMLNGGIPYVDFVEKKPPMTHAAYSIAFLVGGMWNMQAVHLLFIAIAMMTALLVLLSADRLDPSAGIPAFLLFAVYQAGYDLNDFMSAGTEAVMNLFACLAFFLFLKSIATKRRFLFALLAGVAIGLAILSKQVAAIEAIAIAAAYAVESFRNGRPVGIFSDLVALFAGVAVPITALALYLIHADAFPDAMRWLWTENAKYAALQLPFADIFLHGAIRIGLYVLVSLPLWLMATYYIIGEIQGKRFGTQFIALLTWLMLSFVSVSAGGRFFPHYFIQFLPPLCILAAMGWTSRVAPMLSYRRLLRATVMFIVLVLPFAGFFLFHWYEVGILPAKDSAELAIARYVASNTKGDDRIFVWGHSSDIYAYSKRLPASRFVYCSYLTGAREGFEGKNDMNNPPDEVAWNMLLSDLNKNTPSIIVDMSGSKIRGYDTYPISKFRPLDEFVGKHYAYSGSVAGAGIWSIVTK